MVISSERRIRISAIILSIQTLLWLAMMIPSLMQIQPDWNHRRFLLWIASPDILFRISYINVTLLTGVVVFFFVFLYGFYKDQSHDLCVAGLLFLPGYALLNLICYSIQISLIPYLASAYPGEGWVFQLAQAGPGSIMSFLNNLAYGLLGITSILYGMVLYGDGRIATALLLELNGISCILGVIGIIAGSSLLGMGSLIGGLFFLLAMGAAVFEFSND